MTDFRAEMVSSDFARRALTILDGVRHTLLWCHFIDIIRKVLGKHVGGIFTTQPLQIEDAAGCGLQFRDDVFCDFRSIF